MTGRAAASRPPDAAPQEPESRPDLHALPSQPARTEFAHEGLSYVLRIPDASTSIRFSRLKHRSDETTVDVLVRTRIEGVKTVDGVLHSSRLNISAATSRERLAKLLHTRTPGVRVDWHHWLEELSLHVQALETEGSPIGEVGHDPVDWSAPRFAIGPLVPLHEPGLVYGPGGSGKSMLAIAAAVGTAAGREIIPGTTQHAKGPVLYLDWETSRERVNERIVTVCNGAGITPPPGIFYRRQYRKLSDDAEMLAAFVNEKHVALVIIDSAAQAIGAQGDRGDANDGALSLFDAIRILGPEVSTLIVDHVAKTELVIAGKRGRVPYGSVYKVNFSRTAWEIRVGEDQHDGKLHVSLHDFKRNDNAPHAPIGLRLDWQTASVRFERDDKFGEPDGSDVEPQPRMTIADRIADLLGDGAKMQTETIADALGYASTEGHNTIRETLRRKKDRFEKDDRGFWRVTPDRLPL